MSFPVYRCDRCPERVGHVYLEGTRREIQIWTQPTEDGDVVIEGKEARLVGPGFAETYRRIHGETPVLYRQHSCARVA